VKNTATCDFQYWYMSRLVKTSLSQCKMLLQVPVQNYTNLQSFIVHATHGWKALRVYFHTQQRVHHLDFPTRSYSQISRHCSGGQQSRETTSGIHLVVTFHIAYLHKLHFVFTPN
jgi:hypothetical protein